MRFGLHLALERSLSTSACMRLHVSSFPESQKHWAYFMPSLDAMWHHFLLEKESEVHGKHGEYAQRLYSVFHDLSSQLTHVSDAAMDGIERFVVLMYVCTSKLTKVNDARQGMFSKGSRYIEIIPPTADALYQHKRRATYQAGHVWATCLPKAPSLPFPSDWGWIEVNGKWPPVWTVLPQAQETCYELSRYGCKVACHGLCKCNKANLTCTPLCACHGHCYDDQ